MSSKKYGYIYLRTHSSYDVYDAYKLGKASNIPERDSQYAVGEIKRGYFKEVFAIPLEKMGMAERLLQNEFSHVNIRYDGGTEFYHKKISDLIEPYFLSIGMKYRRLTKHEISDLVRCDRERKNVHNEIISKKDTGMFTPRMYQSSIIQKSITYFQTSDKGLLVLGCGVGKTLIGLWIAQGLNSKTILIGVPNKLLLKQWQKVVSELFGNIPQLIISGGVTSENIITFLEKNRKECILITTYSSAYKVYSAAQKLNFIFSIKLLDEVHHLTSINIEEDGKTYVNILKVNSIKQISLTATLKILENKENEREEDIMVSNDSIAHFGEIVERKCLLWAINENIICDYVVQTIVADEDQLLQFDMIYSKDEHNLFLSAFTSLKSIYEGHSHHLLIYCNTSHNSLKINEYIKVLMDRRYFDIPLTFLYYSNYHSEMKTKDQNSILHSFQKSQYGIIVCVYCLGEGWDFPLLDGVVFAENMSSSIRIVQSALRASRKNKDEPDKITKIILPMLDQGNILEDNDYPDLKKVREVIYQMGLEDETISQKIKVFRISIEKQKSKKRIEKVNEFGEYDDELTQKLRLKTIQRNALAITYEKARKIIAAKNIKSKEEYYELCEKDIRISKDPEITFKGKFTSWIEYLSIDRVYYDFETCKKKVADYLFFYPELKKRHLNLVAISAELCKIDKMFPPNELWVDYYNVKELKELIHINRKKKASVIA